MRRATRCAGQRLYWVPNGYIGTLSLCLSGSDGWLARSLTAGWPAGWLADFFSHPRSESGAGSHPMGPMRVRATSPPRCDYTSRVRFTQTYRDGKCSQEVSIAPSHGSYRLRIERNGPIIALWAAVQYAKSLILGTTGLIDPLGPRLHPPNL